MRESSAREREEDNMQDFEIWEEEYDAMHNAGDCDGCDTYDTLIDLGFGFYCPDCADTYEEIANRQMEV